MTKNKRLYSLFTKVEGRYIRLSTGAMFHESAVRLWQGALLGGSCRGMAMYLRPVLRQVDDESPEGLAIKAEREKYFPPR